MGNNFYVTADVSFLAKLAVRLLVAAALAVAGVPALAGAGLLRNGPGDSASASSFMVAAAHPVAAKAGYDVLAAGGTAADAVVAVQFVLNLVEPQSSGLGGGSFLLYWDASERKLTSFDARETAPSAATGTYFIKPDGKPKGFWEAMIGGRSVGVPGTLKLLETVHSRFGGTSWPDLLLPALRLAENGFTVSPRMAESIAAHNTEQRMLGKFAAARSYFFHADGTPLQAGETLRNPEFAATLRDVAKERSKPMYEGKLARQIVAVTSADADNPGVLELADFKSYRVVEREPVCAGYRGYQVCGMGPPSSGGLAVGQIFGVLEHFDMAAAGPTAQGVHLLAEASKLAFADRNRYVGDSDFVIVPAHGMLAPAYLDERAKLVNPYAASAVPVQPGVPPGAARLTRAAGLSPDRPGTSHFVVVDAYGDMASITTTIEQGFGSRLMVGGFLLNNELTDFSFVPERNGAPVANRVQGGKRPRSSMSPTIVFKDGEPVLLIGTPGGSRIIGIVAQTIVAILDWGMDPQSAVALGHAVNRNGPTELEEGTSFAALRGELEALGHQVKVRSINSGSQAVLLANGKLFGGADPRREGVALGD